MKNGSIHTAGTVWPSPRKHAVANNDALLGKSSSRKINAILPFLPWTISICIFKIHTKTKRHTYVLSLKFLTDAKGQLAACKPDNAFQATGWACLAQGLFLGGIQNSSLGSTTCLSSSLSLLPCTGRHLDPQVYTVPVGEDMSSDYLQVPPKWVAVLSHTRGQFHRPLCQPVDASHCRVRLSWKTPWCDMVRAFLRVWLSTVLGFKHQ